MDHTGHTVATVGPRGNRGPEATPADLANAYQKLPELLPLANRTAAHLAGHRTPNDSCKPNGPRDKSRPAASLTVTVQGSSAGTVLVIHNDCRLRIGTVLLAVRWFGRTVLEGAVLGGDVTQFRAS